MVLINLDNICMLFIARPAIFWWSPAFRVNDADAHYYKNVEYSLQVKANGLVLNINVLCGFYLWFSLWWCPVDIWEKKTTSSSLLLQRLSSVDLSDRWTKAVWKGDVLFQTSATCSFSDLRIKIKQIWSSWCSHHLIQPVSSPLWRSRPIRWVFQAKWCNVQIQHAFNLFFPTIIGLLF